jgi:hypothetical protein
MYAANLNHFTDADGNLPQSDNRQWLQLVCFAAMVVDALTLSSLVSYPFFYP